MTSFNHKMCNPFYDAPLIDIFPINGLQTGNIPIHTFEM